jgi:hypothetical protein
MKSELPTINIMGTDFIVDVEKFELREKTDESNKLILADWHEKGNGYGFYYDTSVKNTPYDPGYRNNTTSYVTIPEFVKMAPQEMANKYGITLDEVNGKSDFELMVDQKAYDERVNKGMLPTIDIAGHTFYVDIRMDMLRPKDDFLSNGIVFSDIDNYFDEERNAFFIPYDPKKHEFREIDYETITAIPKDLMVVSFPNQTILDPIGWNRQFGSKLTYGLKDKELKSQFTAKPASWEDIYVPQKIKENLERIKEKPKKEKLQNNPIVPPKNQQEKKGRKI